MSTHRTDEVLNVSLMRLLAFLMFFTFAMTTDAVGSVIPEIIAEFDLSMTAAAAFQIFHQAAKQHRADGPGGTPPPPCGEWSADWSGPA